MGRGAEASNRAALSVAETQAGAVRRLGDITAARWSGLGQNVAGGVESYFTDKEEAEEREYRMWLEEQQRDAVSRKEQARALGGRIASGRDEQGSPIGNMLALETDAGGEFQRTPLGPSPQPSRFRGDAPPGTVRDAAGNFVRAEPALLPAETVRMDPSPYKAIDSRGLELHDIDKIAQQAMEAGVYDEFRPQLEAFEGFNTRRRNRFDEAYADFQGTLKGSLGQPDALMSVAGDAFKHFSSELGGSPRFQALVNAHEAGDPAAFEEMFRRDSNTPIVPAHQLNPDRSSRSPWSGAPIPAEREPEAIPFGPRATIKLNDGSTIQGAQAVKVRGQLEWRDADGKALSGVASVVDPVSGGLTPAQQWRRLQEELAFPTDFRRQINSWLQNGDISDAGTARTLLNSYLEKNPDRLGQLDMREIMTYTMGALGTPADWLAELLRTAAAGGGAGGAAGADPTVTIE
tara:strand:+ start:1633 stop:3015 length:1383 start_codon:yes stop_codon:yes gene_type:complete